MFHFFLGTKNYDSVLAFRRNLFSQDINVNLDALQFLLHENPFFEDYCGEKFQAAYHRLMEGRTNKRMEGVVRQTVVFVRHLMRMSDATKDHTQLRQLLIDYFWGIADNYEAGWVEREVDAEKTDSAWKDKYDRAMDGRKRLTIKLLEADGEKEALNEELEKAKSKLHNFKMKVKDVLNKYRI